MDYFSSNDCVSIVLCLVLCMLALPVPAYFQALPTGAEPFVCYWRCTSIGKYHLVHVDCLLSGIRRLPLFGNSKCIGFMGIYSSWYITGVCYALDVRYWDAH